MEGNLEPKWLGPYAIVEVKESSGYIVKYKYSKELKKVIPVDQVKVYFDQEKDHVIKFIKRIN